MKDGGSLSLPAMMMLEPGLGGAVDDGGGGGMAETVFCRIVWAVTPCRQPSHASTTVPVGGIRVSFFSVVTRPRLAGSSETRSDRNTQRSQCCLPQIRQDLRRENRPNALQERQRRNGDVARISAKV